MTVSGIKSQLQLRIRWERGGATIGREVFLPVVLNEGIWVEIETPDGPVPDEYGLLCKIVSVWFDLPTMTMKYSMELADEDGGFLDRMEHLSIEGLTGAVKRCDWIVVDSWRCRP